MRHAHGPLSEINSRKNWPKTNQMQIERESRVTQIFMYCYYLVVFVQRKKKRHLANWTERKQKKKRSMKQTIRPGGLKFIKLVLYFIAAICYRFKKCHKLAVNKPPYTQLNERKIKSKKIETIKNKCYKKSRTKHATGQLLWNIFECMWCNHLSWVRTFGFRNLVRLN